MQLIYLAMCYEMMYHMMDEICDMFFQFVYIYFYLGGL